MGFRNPVTTAVDPVARDAAARAGRVLATATSGPRVEAGATGTTEAGSVSSVRFFAGWQGEVPAAIEAVDDGDGGKFVRLDGGEDNYGQTAGVISVGTENAPEGGRRSQANIVADVVWIGNRRYESATGRVYTGSSWQDENELWAPPGAPYFLNGDFRIISPGTVSTSLVPKVYTDNSQWDRNLVYADADAFTAAAGWSLVDARLRRFGFRWAVAQLTVQRTGATIATSTNAGNLANIALGTVRTGFAPHYEATPAQTIATGNLAQGYLAAGGDMVLSAVQDNDDIATGDQLQLVTGLYITTAAS